MSFDVGFACRWAPIHVTILWPLAWISLVTALTSLVWLYRRRRSPVPEPRSSGARSAVALHAVLIAILLACSLLTLLYHLNNERFMREHARSYGDSSSALRRALSREYRSDGGAALLGLTMAGLSLVVRTRRYRLT